MRVRGGLGLAGQAMMIASGVRRGEGLKVWSAGIGALANILNLAYGVQKKEDTKRLSEAKHQLDSMLGIVPEPAPDPPSPGMLRQADAVVQRHSVRISDGMKLGSKYLFRMAGLEANNAANSWHGNLSMMAKLVTLAGKDEDPYVRPSQKSALSRAREYSNLISGSMELAAQYPLFPGALNRKNNYTGVRENDWLQLGAATLFTGALLAKCFAPFTEERINREALFEYAAKGVRQRPDSMPEVARYLSDMLQNEVRIRSLPAEEEMTKKQVEEELQRRLSEEGKVARVLYQGRVSPEPLTLRQP